MVAKHQAISALALALLALAGVRSAAALSAPPGLEGIWEADREAVEALALYPEDVRHAVLEASTRPGVLARIESIRAWSNRDFRALLSSQPQEEQAELWELVRYPGLVAELVAGGRKSTRALERIAADYPEEIRETAVECAREHYDLLVEIDALHQEADEAFEDLIAVTPPQTRAAFRKLMALPEVLSILTDRMRMTALLGEAYERDPEDVEAVFAELHLEVARENAESLREWEQELEENPELLEELEVSVQVFAEENGYEQDAPRPATAVNFYLYPYPYWFGFPFWIDVGFWYPPWHAHWLWYPRPYWAHAGFYYGPHYAPVVFGVPSFHYLHWHFSSHRSHHRYRHLPRRVAHHFEAHHRRHVERRSTHSRHVEGGSTHRRHVERGSTDRRHVERGSTDRRHAEREITHRRHRQVSESGEREQRHSQRRVRATPFVSKPDHQSPGRSRARAARGEATDRVPEARQRARARDPRPRDAARSRDRATSRDSDLRRAEPRRVERQPTRERRAPVRVARADRAERRPTQARPQRARVAKAQPRERRPAQVKPQAPRVAKARPVEQRAARVKPERHRERVSPREHVSAPGGGRQSVGRLGSAGHRGRSGSSRRHR